MVPPNIFVEVVFFSNPILVIACLWSVNLYPWDPWDWFIFSYMND